MNDDIDTPANASWEVDQHLDVKGLDCPLPILRTKLALSKMMGGEVLHVEATDPHSVIDFQAFCDRTAHELLRMDRGEALFQFFIRRAEK
ncbi:MAG: sulfurtransferase TusA family protein [Gammaproteobacteria bacterium]|nr:sulfurtransferase TusA family protein [Gammaproteobacteria bacterium]